MKRKISIRSKEMLILMKLKIAITSLSNDVGGKTKGQYKVKIHKIRPVEMELVTIGRLNNKIKFEVREKETHHNEAHFHITIKGEGSGSYRISDFSRIESDIPTRTERKLLDWAKENRQLFVDTWNEFHGYRITVA